MILKLKFSFLYHIKGMILNMGEAYPPSLLLASIGTNLCARHAGMKCYGYGS